MKKKILFCSENFYPDVGGVQNHAKLICEFLIKNKYDVTVATSFTPLRKRQKINNIKIIDFKIKGNLINGYIGNIAKYQNMLLEKKYDYIFFYAAQQWTFDLAIPLIHKINARKIFMPCGFSKLNNILYFFYFKILSKKLKFFDKIVCFSKSYKDYLYCKKFYQKKIDIIFNAGFKYKKKIKIKKDKYLKILNVGKFNYNKNQILLIFLAIFIKKKAKITFVFNNKNYYFYLLNILSKFVQLFKKDKIFIFKYNLNKNKILKLYKESDIFIFTSKVECSPLVLYDCCANLLPFISSDVGNAREIAKKYNNGTVYNGFFDLISKTNSFNKYLHLKNFTTDFEWETQLLKYLKLLK